MLHANPHTSISLELRPEKGYYDHCHISVIDPGLLGNRCCMSVQVKEAMVDDAQASIAALKTQLSAAQAEAAESAQALRHAEADLSEHEAEEQRQHQSLR